MVDYLESLERLAMPDELHIKECEKLGISLTEDFDIVEQALQRLESIDNAEPSEALECLERIEADLTGFPKHVTEYDDGFDSYLEDIWNNIDTIKQALIKAEKSLKALEIIKEKKIIDIKWLKSSRNYKEYNSKILDVYNDITSFLTEEEFNLLKEVLENE